jgi:hypothetical protein
MTKRNIALPSALILRNRPKKYPSFISTIITGDESWVYRYDTEIRQQSSSKMKSSPWPKEAQQVQNNVKSMLIYIFDTEGIMNKEFLPSGQAVNGNFCWDVLKDNIRLRLPVKWHNNSWPFTMATWPPTCHSLCGIFDFNKNYGHHPPSLLTRSHPPYFSFCFQKWKRCSRDYILGALKRSRSNRRMCWRYWRKITSTSAFNYGSSSGIAILTQKETTLKEMEVNKNFDKWISLGRRNPVTFR